MELDFAKFDRTVSRIATQMHTRAAMDTPESWERAQADHERLMGYCEAMSDIVLAARPCLPDGYHEAISAVRDRVHAESKKYYATLWRADR